MGSPKDAAVTSCVSHAGGTAAFESLLQVTPAHSLLYLGGGFFLWFVIDYPFGVNTYLFTGSREKSCHSPVPQAIRRVWLLL